MNQQQSDMKHTLQYIHSELNRVQTIAGTLSSVETQHYKVLTDMGDDQLNRIAAEEQNAARQLGEVKQICVALAQKVEQMEHNYV